MHVRFFILFTDLLAITEMEDGTILVLRFTQHTRIKKTFAPGKLRKSRRLFGGGCGGGGVPIPDLKWKIKMPPPLYSAPASPEEIDLSVGDGEAGGQHPFHRHVPVVKLALRKK